MTLWTVALQAPLSMGFPRQEYWSGLPCPSPGDLPDPGIEPMSLVSPTLAGRFFTTSTTWETHYYTYSLWFFFFLKMPKNSLSKTKDIGNNEDLPYPLYDKETNFG